LSIFAKLLVIRVICPDKYSLAVSNLIIQEMSNEFVNPPPFNLELSIKDATPLTPLIFILSPGADPRLEILRVAEDQGFK